MGILDSLTSFNRKETSPSQDFVPIKDIQDNFIVLKDNSLRAVLMTSSSNFALKSTDERASIIYQFQAFLNSLDFSVQISVQSRRLQIEPYLETLKERLEVQENDLLRTQIEEYMYFIRDFTENVNVMRKSFFVVVPYSAAPINNLSGRKKRPSRENAQHDEALKNARTQLEQRVSVVESGLTRCGIRVARLTRDELFELYQGIFNPGPETSIVSD